MRALIFAALLLAPALVGCNAYDPDLGEKPFRCGGTDPAKPECPDGYEAVKLSETSCECLRDDDVSTDAPPITFSCNDDSSATGDPGGNEDTAGASSTLVGQGHANQVFSTLSLCPAADVDVFSLKTTTGGTEISATITYNQRIGDVELEILDGDGATIARGVVDMASSTQTATYVASTAGTYYARIRPATGASENNYSLQLEIDEP